MTEVARRIILTGPIGSGKSTLAEALTEDLSRQGLVVAGMVAQGLWRDQQRYGFDLLDITTRRLTPLARRNSRPAPEAITQFDFFEEGWQAGKEALTREKCCRADFIVVDEVGKMEIQGQGWAPLLSSLLAWPAVHLWVVRAALVETICRIWPAVDLAVVDITQAEARTRLIDLCWRQTEK